MNIKKTVKDYLFEYFLFGYQQDDLGDTASLLELGILDSTGIMELVTFLEREFEIEIGDQEILPENLESLENIQAFVSGKLKRV